ncbi:MAG: hypothetical protein KKB31_03015 [Nanoarchaeota archaeon]|nr:hypothetical protein [Nanoarchaeota archaeon]
MKFKFTLWKTIVSLLVFIFVDVLLAASIICLTGDFGSCSHWTKHLFEPGMFLIALIPGVIVYIGWSLIQKE